MKVLIGLFALLMTGGGASPPTIVAQGRGVLAVWPRSASPLQPIALDDLVVAAIPATGDMSWESLQIQNVQWITDGIAYYPNNGEAYRQGLVRVRASGVRATLLRQKVEELAWTVEMSTEGSPKWGPTTITIRPGLTSEQSKGDYICFGIGFTGCDFPVSAISGPRIKYIKQCEIGSGGGSSVVFRAKTADGRAGTVVYQGSGGSGGYSNSVEISTLSPAQYCATFKDRGY